MASTLLESFLFYSGFPDVLVPRAKLTNTADMIRPDHSRRGCTATSAAGTSAVWPLVDEARAKSSGIHLRPALRLYENEIEYTQDLYDGSWADRGRQEVPALQRHQGADEPRQQALFPRATDVNPAILSALSPKPTHDFFSGSG